MHQDKLTIYRSDAGPVKLGGLDHGSEEGAEHPLELDAVLGGIFRCGLIISSINHAVALRAWQQAR